MLRRPSASWPAGRPTGLAAFGSISSRGDLSDGEHRTIVEALDEGGEDIALGLGAGPRANHAERPRVCRLPAAHIGRTG